MTDDSDPPPLPPGSDPDRKQSHDNDAPWPAPEQDAAPWPVDDVYDGDIGDIDDDEPATDEPEAKTSDDATVLARGHLHPSILLLRLLDALRQVAFPVILGLLQPWFLVAALGLFLLQLTYSVIRYLTLEYTLTPEELRIREGLLHRQERRIPLDRIQDLGFESTILRRALGLTVVLVETASGRGVEARLDALSRAHAEHLREVLLAARLTAVARSAERPAADDTDVATTSETPAAPAEPELEWLVHRSTTRELLMRGATDMRLSAFAVTGYAAYELANQLGFVTQLAGIAQTVHDWLSSLPTVVVLAVLAGLMFVVVALGIVTATVGNLVQFHGFQIVLRGNVLQRRYGLLTTRQKTLPRERVQRVTIEQTWLRRLLGYSVMKADSAGGSRPDGQDTTAGWDVVVPLTKATTAHALLPALLPGIENTQFEWHRGSKKLVIRTALQGCMLAGVAIAATWWRLEANSLFALLLVPIWAILGVLVWRNLGWASGDEFFALQHGIVGKNFATVPTKKVQAVVVRQGIVGQLLGVADLTVYVAGGSPTCIPDLTLRDARMLSHDLSQRAALAAARDW